MAGTETPKTADDKSSFTAKARTDALPPPPPHVLCQALGVPSISIDWLAGDGSDRCYYRLSLPDSTNTLVLMQLSGSDAEALRINGYDWINIANILDRHTIFIPRVVKALPDFASLIIEDYGNTMLETLILEESQSGLTQNILEHYDRSFEIIGKMLQIKPQNDESWCRRSFDQSRFAWELNFFNENYLSPVAKITLTESEAKDFNRDVGALSEFLGGFSHWFVHRDFHSRNLMVKNGKIALIDFQDARLGPSAYDLVSLCFDSYVPLTMDFRLKLIEKATLTIAQMAPHKAAAEIGEHWRPMLLQRQLKAIGSFGYLSLKKNRGNYLKYVKPALNTLIEPVVFDERWPFISGTLIQKLNLTTSP